jgi:hypothetical protein
VMKIKPRIPKNGKLTETLETFLFDMIKLRNYRR